MRIQELIISNFGKFTDEHITLSDGINVVYGENESGKSTVHTFIKSMFFGLERGRGRASVNDTFSMYEPWGNANYYSGMLRFKSGGKHFCIERNFDKYSKKAKLICEDDGEELSVADGDLEMILGGLKASVYDDTVSIGQLNVQPGQTLAGELKNYATNYYSTGNSDIDLEEAFGLLNKKKKLIEKEIKEELEKKQDQREKIELEASYVWRDIHEMMTEQEDITAEIACRREQNRKEEQETKGVIDELRPDKWRIHPVEILIFIAAVVVSFTVVARPWNYLVAIILFLICGIYVWNRMKVSKKQVKTAPEIILEEITPDEEKISLERLEWEKARLEEDLKEKQIQYNNLQEQLEELDEISQCYKENEKKRLSIQLASERLEQISRDLQEGLEHELNEKASKILSFITGGKYSKLIIEDNLRMSLMSLNRKIPIEQVSRGTIEQIYFALRMAVSELLHEEEYPVLLDDTFAFYDDKRLKNTLKWLQINRRQVIIFTCQQREIQALRELNVPWELVWN